MSGAAQLPAKTKRRGGRPTVRTAERATILCDAVARGVPHIHACSIAGISFSVFCEWRNDDSSFRQAIEQSVARGVEVRLKKIERASDAGDWRASAWLLEHCQPEFFAKTRVQVEAVGQLEHSFVIPQQLLTDIADARARIEKQHEQKPDSNGA